MTIGLATISFDLTGIEGLEADIGVAYDNLVHELDYIVEESCEAGIREMQANHPYTDRTFLLSGGMHITEGKRTRTRCTKYIDFMAPYAGYVNDGTSKSQPYPFLPQGIEAAQRNLDERMNSAMDRYCRTVAGG